MSVFPISNKYLIEDHDCVSISNSSSVCLPFNCHPLPWSCGWHLFVTLTSWPQNIESGNYRLLIFWPVGKFLPQFSLNCCLANFPAAMVSRGHWLWNCSSANLALALYAAGWATLLQHPSMLFHSQKVRSKTNNCEAQARVRQGWARDGSEGKRPQSLNPCLELTLKLVATFHHPPKSLNLFSIR